MGRFLDSDGRLKTLINKKGGQSIGGKGNFAEGADQSRKEGVPKLLESPKRGKFSTF